MPTRKSLSEAAAEILKSSASGAPAQPQQSLEGDESGLGKGENLGGDTPDHVAPTNYTKDGKSTTGGKAKEPGPAPKVAQMPKDKLRNNNKSIDIDKQRQGTNTVTVSTHHHTHDPQLTDESVEHDGANDLKVQYDEDGNIYDLEGNHIPGLMMTAEGQIVEVDGEMLDEEEGEEPLIYVTEDAEGNEILVDAEGNELDPEVIEAAIAAAEAAEQEGEEVQEESVILFDREALYEAIKGEIDSDLGSLLEGFDAEQSDKIRTVFEAAVMSRVDQAMDTLEQAFIGTLAESVEEVKVQLAEQTEDYLSFIAEEWMKNNEIAVEQGLRTELAEDFINGMKNLFVEHYIDIPEDKVNVIEELSDEVAQTEAKLNEQIQRNVELSKQVRVYQAGDVFAAVCENLTDVQVDKMRSLAEGIEFSTADEFKKKLEMLRNNYFSGAKLTESKATKPTKTVDGGLNEAIEVEDDKIVMKSNDPMVNTFVQALDRASQSK